MPARSGGRIRVDATSQGRPVAQRAISGDSGGRGSGLPALALPSVPVVSGVGVGVIASDVLEALLSLRKASSALTGDAAIALGTSVPNITAIREMVMSKDFFVIDLSL